MKRFKFLIVIIVIGIIVFLGIETFRKKEYVEVNESEEIITNKSELNNETENVVTTDRKTEENDNSIQREEVINNENQVEQIQNGQELMQKAEKTIKARGWAGASNNVIGLKDGIIYYYNKETEEFYVIAEGIDDIYYSADYAEEITAKKNSKFKEIEDTPEFLIYE